MIPPTFWSAKSDHAERLARLGHHARASARQSYLSCPRFRSSGSGSTWPPTAAATSRATGIRRRSSPWRVALVVGIGHAAGCCPRRAARAWRCCCSPAYVAWAYCRSCGPIPPGARWEAANKMLLFLAARLDRCRSCPGPTRPPRGSSARGRWGWRCWPRSASPGASGTHHLSNYLFEFRYQHPVGYANGNAALGAIGHARGVRHVHRPRRASAALRALPRRGRAAGGLHAARRRAAARSIGVAVAAPVFLMLRARPPAGRSAAAGPRAGRWRWRRARSSTSTTRARSGARSGRALDDAVAAACGLRARWRARPGWSSPSRSGRRAGTRAWSARHARAGLVAGRAAGGSRVVALALVNIGRISDTVDRAVDHAHRRRVRLRRGRPDLEPRSRTSAPTTGGWRSTSSRSLPWAAWAPATSSASTRRGGTSPSTRATCTTCSCGRWARAARWPPRCSWASSCRCSWRGPARRRLARAPALVLATTLAIAAYFAVHLNFDWLEEIPAVASPAFALPIVALVAAWRARAAARGQAPPRAATLVASGRLGRGGGGRRWRSCRWCPPTCRCAT